MTLKALVRLKMIEDVVRASRKKGEWKVLVVDQLSLAIISWSTKMREITQQCIAIVEDIDKKREPLPFMEAIYLISPTDKSIRQLEKDFVSNGKLVYKAAHIYFTQSCPDQLFKYLCNSGCAKYIKTLKEINVSFVPYESHVFSLDTHQWFTRYYNPTKPSQPTLQLQYMAEQVATLCATLGEYPLLRYRSGYERNVELAQLIQQKLDTFKAYEPTMSEDPQKSRSQLLIIDRGFDCVTPLLHELTYQAMAYDLLPIERDIYRFGAKNGSDVRDKEVILDDSDQIWTDLRHQHIGLVSQNVVKNLKKLKSDIEMLFTNLSVKYIIKKMPQYQKELFKYKAHLDLAESCMARFNDYVDRLRRVEQDLAMGTDIDGHKIKDPIHKVLPIVLNEDINTLDKIRIILLYIIHMDGITQPNLSKLIQHAYIRPQDIQIITNMSYLSLNVVVDSDPKKVRTITRKKRKIEHMDQICRWTPVIKDVMEDLIDGKLDTKHYPFLKDVLASTKCDGLVPSIRRWGKKFRDMTATNSEKVSRLIVFIIGGMSYSEMRCAYEVTDKNNNCEVFIGSDHIITPQTFLQSLRDLSD